MTQWHGYILIEQPKALTEKQWADVLAGLFGYWNTTPKAEAQWIRLATRYSLKGDKCIVESNFDPRDLDTADVARLPKYAADTAKTVTAAQMTDLFRGKVTVFAAGMDREKSAQACRDYLAANSAEWATPMEEPTVMTRYLPRQHADCGD